MQVPLYTWQKRVQLGCIFDGSKIGKWERNDSLLISQGQQSLEVVKRSFSDKFKKDKTLQNKWINFCDNAICCQTSGTRTQEISIRKWRYICKHVFTIAPKLLFECICLKVVTTQKNATGHSLATLIGWPDLQICIDIYQVSIFSASTPFTICCRHWTSILAANSSKLDTGPLRWQNINNLYAPLLASVL